MPQTEWGQRQAELVCLGAGCWAALVPNAPPQVKLSLGTLSCFRWSFDSASDVSAEVKVPIKNAPLPPPEAATVVVLVGDTFLFPGKTLLILLLHKWSQRNFSRLGG